MAFVVNGVDVSTAAVVYGFAPDRPATPPGPMIYRAIDTSVTTLWDGASWSMLEEPGAPSAPAIHDFASSAGWTTVNGTGTAVITGGVLRLSHAVGADAYCVGSINYDGASAYRSLVCRSDFDVCVRLAAMSVDPGSYALLEVADATAAGVRYSCLAQGNGTVRLMRLTDNLTLLATAGVFGAFTGQEWLRLSVRGGSITAYTGVGAGGARPTLWTPLGDASPASTAWAYVALSVEVIGIAGTSTTDFDDLTVVDLGGGL